jgi:hypothetical protein
MYMLSERCCCFEGDSKFYKRRKKMFEVSDRAGEVIKQFLEGKNGPDAVRIALMEGG